MSDKIVPPDVSEINLSKLKNIEAVKKVEPTFGKKVEKQVKGKRFSFAEPDLIPLPSKGLLYHNVTKDENILNGRILVLPMTLKEEEILSTSRFIKTGATTRMILDRVIVSDIEAKDVLIYDSNFIMFHLRRISYGDEYKFNLTCGNPICEKKFEHTVIISKLEFEELPDDFEEPIIVELPISKYTVKAILPRLYHSEEIAMKNSSRVKTTKDEDRRWIDNLLITTVEILDSEGQKIPRKDWEEFFESIPGLDSATLREKTIITTGVDKLEGVVCPYCETDFSGTIPIGADFFRL